LEEEIHYLRSVLEGQRIQRAHEDGFQGSAPSAKPSVKAWTSSRTHTT
jgi:hypothetical protein